METKVYESVFICPICGERLDCLSTRAVCETGHSFDRSRRGYYNLLVGRGGAHGDNKEMVLARRKFLSFDLYAPLKNAVSRLVLKHTKRLGRVLDIGCGEGYYTTAVEKALFERDGESCVYAFDISKDAMSEVGKKSERIKTAVFGAYHMPIADESLDSAVNMFSPLAPDEVARVLKPKGIFIMAIPDTEHLFELKSALYKTPYKNTVSDSALSGFTLIGEESIKYEMALDSQEKINSLFMMTPYAYRTPPEARCALSSMSRLDCTAHFRIFVYEKSV
jgi:23S rRNA (guanine745-N1)-methyltransferase